MMSEVPDSSKAPTVAVCSPEQREISESLRLSTHGLKATIRSEMQNFSPDLLEQRVIFSTEKGETSASVRIPDLVENAYLLRHTQAKDGHSTVVRMSITRLRAVMQLLLPCLQGKKPGEGGYLQVKITQESPKCLQDLARLFMEA